MTTKTLLIHFSRSSYGVHPYKEWTKGGYIVPEVIGHLGNSNHTFPAIGIGVQSPILDLTLWNKDNAFWNDNN